MTVEKAIKAMKFYKEKLYNGIFNQFIAAFDVAISALEKQIPQTPILQGDGYADGELVYDYAECPVCGCDFEEESSCWGCKFCPDCGQKLSWESDTE